jgi:hypothetical protein
MWRRMQDGDIHICQRQTFAQSCAQLTGSDEESASAKAEVPARQHRRHNDRLRQPGIGGPAQTE